MSHRRQSFCLILSVSLLLSRRPHHARESVGRRKSPSIIGGANGSAPAATPSPREQYVLDRLSTFSVQGPRQRVQGRRERLPATTCQRSARASCYGVRSQFWTRGRDTYSAWLQCQPSPSRPGHKTHSHRRSDFYPEAQIRQMAVQKSAGCCPKNAKSNHRSALNITPQTADQRAPDAGRAGEPRTRKAAMKRCSRKRQETLTGLSPSCG